MADKIMLLVQRLVVKPDGSIPYGPNDRILTRDEMVGLISPNFPASEVQHALDVSSCESGWHTGAWARVGEDSRGIFQINVGPGAHTDLAIYDLFDPSINAYWAGVIFKQSGWGPWTCAHKLGIV